MTRVGIRALQQNASAVVAQAASGQVITITDRGRDVAQMTPLPRGGLRRHLDDGTARLPRCDLAALPAPAPGPSLSDAVAQDRSDARY